MRGESDLYEFIVRGRSPPPGAWASFWFATRFWRGGRRGTRACSFFPLVLSAFDLRRTGVGDRKGGRSLSGAVEKREKSINTVKEHDHEEECVDFHYDHY